MIVVTTTATKTVRTLCPMNCHPTHCGMLAEVAGVKLKSIAGDKEIPDSRGFLCVRGRATSEIFGNPKRLLHPVVRDDRNSDDWRQVSWEEAIARIASRMRAAGGEAVGLWAGHGAFTAGAPIAVQMMQRFANLYGCQSWHPAMVCWGLGGFGVAVG